MIKNTIIINNTNPIVNTAIFPGVNISLSKKLSNPESFDPVFPVGPVFPGVPGSP